MAHPRRSARYRMRLRARRWRLAVKTRARAGLWREEGIGRRLARVPRIGSALAAPPPGERRVEIGSGRYPTPGYVHVDCDPTAPHLEFLCHAHAIPLPDGWADEILSVHVVEHVPGGVLRAALRHWHDLLVPGGRLEVHTPSGESIGRVMADPSTPASTFWAVQNGAFGYDLHPADATGPERLTASTEHRFLLSRAVLVQLLEDAGFTDVDAADGRTPCRHREAWQPYVPDFCLELVARKPA